MKILRIDLVVIACALVCPLRVSAQTNADEARVLNVVQEFFDALEKQDTAGLRRICLAEARNYSVRNVGDSAIVRSQPSTGIRFNPKQILKERMRKAVTKVQVKGSIAMVWAPYDLWVNDTFSHCGVDVFTMIRTSEGWKVASIAWTVEQEGCE